MNNDLGIIIDSKTKNLESALRKIVKILNDDTSFQIINYIIKYKEAEEQKLAYDLNMSYKQVRQALILMENHGIIYSYIRKVITGLSINDLRKKMTMRNIINISKWLQERTKQVIGI